MAQPTAYTPATDFSDDEANAVGGRSTVRTAALDAELSALNTTLDGVLTNLALNQRDDGEIRDARVKLHTLAADVRALFVGAGVKSTNLRGDWVTATAYVVMDVVVQSGNTYICATAHTSGTFATDLAADKWILLALGAGVAGSAVSFAPTVTIAATSVQAAIEEVDAENRALSAAVRSELADVSTAGDGDAMVGWSAIYDVRDGVLTRHASLAAAVSAIGSTRCTVVVRDDITMAASATFPSTATLEIQNGARITTTGFSLTAKVRCPRVQWVVGSGSVTILPGSDQIVPQWWGAVGDGVTNDTAAFTAARAASGGRYHLPGGYTYLVDASPDVWDDLFTADGSTNIKISSTTYDVSNAIAGPWRWAAGSDVLLNLKHAVTGNNVIQLQAGSSGQATYFQRTVSIKCDSHFMQVAPGTNGGSTDLLVQRSDANADPAGNRFNFTFEETSDRFKYSYATTASGAPSFDSYLEVVAGTSPTLTFPALRPMFNAGWRVKQRAAGGFEIEFAQVSSTVAELKQIGGSAATYLHFRDGAMGFFGSTGTSRPTVTGSRGGNAALADLLTELATLGLITDSTTA